MSRNRKHDAEAIARLSREFPGMEDMIREHFERCPHDHTETCGFVYGLDEVRAGRRTVEELRRIYITELRARQESNG